MSVAVDQRRETYARHVAEIARRAGNLSLVLPIDSARMEWRVLLRTTAAFERLLEDGPPRRGGAFYFDPCWEHLLSSGRQIDVRFVIDVLGSQVIRIEERVGRGWKIVEPDLWRDVEASLFDNRIQEQARAYALGLLTEDALYSLVLPHFFANDLPEWAGGEAEEEDPS